MTWTTRPRSDLGGLRAVQAGNGPPVLLIHGVGLRAEAWGAQIDVLAGDYHVIAIDMPGHGESPFSPGLERLADYTDAVLKALSAPAWVIGHSMGAMIALDLASRFPETVRGVGALNAIFGRDGAAKIAVKQRAKALDGETVPDPSATLHRWFGTTASPEREACANWLSSVDPRGYRAAYRVFAAENGPSEPDLCNLHCPVLFMTGAEEPNSTPEMSQQMGALAPQGKCHVVQGAAHMMPMTHAEDVNVYLRDFIVETLT